MIAVPALACNARAFQNKYVYDIDTVRIYGTVNNTLLLFSLSEFLAAAL